MLGWMIVGGALGLLGSLLEEEAAAQERAEKAKPTGRDGLRFSTELNSAGWVDGEIDNIGRSTYRKITLNVIFKDKKGKIVDRCSKSVVYSGGSALYPGESRDFIVWTSSKRADTVEISVGECLWD